MPPKRKAQAESKKAQPAEYTLRNEDECEEEEGELLPELDEDTLFLIDLIFQTDMFNHALKELKLDTKKLTLENLSKPQIMKGFDLLEKLDTAIAQNETSVFSELSSEFYTIIPHDFGRSVSPDINTQALLKTEKGENTKKPNPLYTYYAKLNVELKLLDRNVEDFDIIKKYFDNTKCDKTKCNNTKCNHTDEILNIWVVNRKGEDERFRKHKDMPNYKLLWHGTDIARVASILQFGLRIMPKSKVRRVGKGIYFASEFSKSAKYVRCNPSRLGVMFLNEVALGREKLIYKNQPNYTQAPIGFNSVVAKGKFEPEFDKEIPSTINYRKVTIPTGEPLPTGISTDFSQSAYVVYKESQCRIRYLLLCKFN